MREEDRQRIERGDPVSGISVAAAIGFAVACLALAAIILIGAYS